MGLASQPTAASFAVALADALVGFGDLRAALCERALAIRGDQPLHCFDQRRQRGFGVAGDGEVDFDVAAEVLIVGLVIQLDGGDGDDLRARLR